MRSNVKEFLERQNDVRYRLEAMLKAVALDTIKRPFSMVAEHLASNLLMPLDQIKPRETGFTYSYALLPDSEVYVVNPPDMSVVEGHNHLVDILSQGDRVSRVRYEVMKFDLDYEGRPLEGEALSLIKCTRWNKEPFGVHVTSYEEPRTYRPSSELCGVRIPEEVTYAHFIKPYDLKCNNILFVNEVLPKIQQADLEFVSSFGAYNLCD